MLQLSRRMLHFSGQWHQIHGKQVVTRTMGASVAIFLSPSTNIVCRWSSTRPFEKVLIANRGEVACRVIRTCRQLGIETVAIYSSADGPSSLHASMADEAYCIGTGPSARESYLRGDEIIDIAQRSGAQAIHPGYGFLSENADFCGKIDKANLSFVGPGPKAIQAMGSKSESKSLMESAGVPIIPGYHGVNQDPIYLLHQAVTNVGFPLLIKAVMGGGGKGMRLVWEENEFPNALQSCQRESQSAFGDSSILLEKYLVHPRHVEVQIVADTHGNVLHLYERDCSLQRRHQKVIEEAPASDLPMDIRRKFGGMGKCAARAVGYVNAGTVEFLLDTQQQDSGKFYFCEMNTRLQVEHPVTELITGIDLVEWQLRIAAGEELPITDQVNVPCRGHALEARIYAENPCNDFLPATGNIWHHCPPTNPNCGIGSNGVRVDTGIQPGHDIGVYYDPMISKLIVHGSDREAAITKLISALKQYQIAGIPTNIDFLVQCAQHPTFQTAGAVNTGFLDVHADEINLLVDTQSSLARAISAFVTLLHLERRVGVKDLDTARKITDPWSPYQGSWRMGGDRGRVKRTLKLLECSSEELLSDVECWSNRDGSMEIAVPSINYVGTNNVDRFVIDGSLDSNNRMEVNINGIRRMTFTAVLKEEEGVIRIRVWDDNTYAKEYTWEIAFYNPMVPLLQNADENSVIVQGTVKAPMPGKIIRINTSPGEVVREGDIVMVMEAMKMEHAIKAPREGTVGEIGFGVGDVVEDGALLAVLVENEFKEVAS